MESLEQKTIPTNPSPEPFKINLLTLPLPELEILLKSWGFPAYRGKQIYEQIFSQGVSDIDEMNNLPLKLRTVLKERATIGALHLEIEQISTDGTKKRAYKLHDGQVIESVLMPYEDGRRTACISSQAGCAMGCVFCATGQMGFARQLTAEEIYEQVARFASELNGEGERLSNVVMMGMGEPLANYRNVIAAIRRMNTELGIGARKITVSTVGIVPNIRKLMNEDVQVRLALSLHCATDEERSALLPANQRYGGLDELMSTIREYIQVKKQRVTFEWALIEGENDTTEVAHTLGKLLQKHNIRSDMSHVNLIPLNPTGGFGGGPSGKASVQKFVGVLERVYGVSATPRMRRGIDINAGCGQLTASVKKKEDALILPEVGALPMVGVYEDEVEGSDDEVEIQDLSHGSVAEDEEEGSDDEVKMQDLSHGSVVDFSIDSNFINLDDEDDDEDFLDPTYEDELEMIEVERLLGLIKGTSLQQTSAPTISSSPETEISSPELSLPETKTTKITDEDALRKAKRRRKKLVKQLKEIQKLKDAESGGKVLNQEQLTKVAKEKEWTTEVESVEHNLM
eukprot:CAMPEP_0172308738 /NCGR_PEP_ID=MMETSP1058-20130122/9245_1 /TAXON_ID=83371 /ORGANISM="Detonula confervacea, Strain CCMP 353" /LENGTH=569 /DNA_ID=CAMNT_0013021229 /DNA_START=166 /DNA_END=1875 /DNA_ORIENTATION=-